jgi:hypothetical protein
VLCLALGYLLVGGCKQSLFDSHGDDTMVDGSSVASSCPATCLADAAADYGTAKWRFLDDNRNRTWTAMTMGSSGFTGAGSNKIAECKHSSSEACDGLPGALVVTTTGSATTADPALSYTATAKQVVQLTVRVYVPASAPNHEVRLYRNSREDVLFTAIASPGGVFERAITLDAIKDDRFYLALAGTDQAAHDVAVHFYVNATADTFPIACQLALSFTSPPSNMADNACGVGFTYKNMGTATPWALGTAPFDELGTSADITKDKYFEGSDVIVRSGDSTTQLWLRHDAFVDTYNTVIYSDDDLDNTGGLTIYVLNQSPPKLGAETCTGVTQTTLDFAWADGAFPDDHAWHFVRVVHTNGMVKVCVDGVRTASYALPAGKMQSMFPPWLGRNLNWTPQGGFLDGAIDDVRVIGAALPCD